MRKDKSFYNQKLLSKALCVIQGANSIFLCRRDVISRDVTSSIFRQYLYFQTDSIKLSFSGNAGSDC